MPSPKVQAGFIEPMLLLRTEKLPEGASLLYELKLDGYSRCGVQIGRQGPPPFRQ
jgi:ATP-dependent DNA ligase